MTTFHNRTPWIILTAAIAIAVFWVDHGRANAPPGRYTIMNGTVYDTKTHLTWQQVAPSQSFNYNSALNYCTTLTLAGGGWRVPSVKELQTIVDESRSAPGIDTTVFLGSNGFVWSSSRVGGTAFEIWQIDFGYDGSSFWNRETSFGGARCVR